MNSNEIYTAIEEIANTPAKNDKVALVTKYAAAAEFKRVLVAALDPLTTYGVRKFLPLERQGAGVFGTPEWVLIEQLATRALTGNAALLAIKNAMEGLTPESATLLQRIVKKDLRAGFDASTCNKAVKGLIRTFPYMRCSLPKDVKMDGYFDDGAFSQEKADGMFLNLDNEMSGVIRLTSRQGTEFPLDAFDELLEEVRKYVMPNTQTHGEMLVTRDGVILPREEGNGILNHIADGGAFGPGEKPLYLAWDQIPLDVVVPKGKYEAPYHARLLQLATQLVQFEKVGDGNAIALDHLDQYEPRSSMVQLIETEFVRNMDEAMAHYRKKLLARKEGTIVKRFRALWKDGTSKEQIKLKLKVPVELRIKGFVEGNGKYAGMLGAFQMESECGQLKTNVNARGDAQRAEVWANQAKYLDGIATVDANGIMKPGDSSPFFSLFLPVLSEIRTDKSEADDLGRIQAQFEAAVSA